MTLDTQRLRELAQNAAPGPWTQWEDHGWVMAGTQPVNGREGDGYKTRKGKKSTVRSRL